MTKPMHALFSATLTKRTSILKLHSNLDGESGTAPWLRAKPKDPVKRAALEKKIEQVNKYFCTFSFLFLFLSTFVSVFLHFWSTTT